MSIILNTLYQTTKDKYKLRLLCGQNGLLKELTWIYYTEDINTMDFIRKGNLIITTGLSINPALPLRQFVEEVMKRDTIGLIINIGRYISEKDLDEEILSLCEAQNFPLFTLPWEIHLSDIMQDYLNSVLLEEAKEKSLINIFQNVLHNPKHHEEYRKDILPAPFKQVQNFRIIFFRPFQCVITEENEQHILFRTRNKLNEKGIPYFLFFSSLNLILILCDALCDSAEKIAKDILVSDRTGSYASNAGISNTVSFELLWQARQQASIAAAVAAAKKESCLNFNDLGLFRLFLAINAPTVLSGYSEQLLSPLKSYDDSHKTAFYNTLRIYLENNGSLKNTAQLLFTHRNTINYRMRQIRKLLRCDLSNPSVRNEYLTAFLIADYLHMEPQ